MGRGHAVLGPLLLIHFGASSANYRMFKSLGRRDHLILSALFRPRRKLSCFLSSRAPWCLVVAIVSLSPVLPLPFASVSGCFSQLPSQLGEAYCRGLPSVLWEEVRHAPPRPASSKFLLLAPKIFSPLADGNAESQSRVRSHGL